MATGERQALDSRQREDGSFYKRITKRITDNDLRVNIQLEFSKNFHVCRQIRTNVAK